VSRPPLLLLLLLLLLAMTMTMTMQQTIWALLPCLVLLLVAGTPAPTTPPPAMPCA
jgi:hypothetical protein